MDTNAEVGHDQITNDNNIFIRQFASLLKTIDCLNVEEMAFLKILYINKDAHKNFGDISIYSHLLLDPPAKIIKS